MDTALVYTLIALLAGAAGFYVGHNWATIKAKVIADAKAVEVKAESAWTALKHDVTLGLGDIKADINLLKADVGLLKSVAGIAGNTASQPPAAAALAPPAANK